MFLNIRYCPETVIVQSAFFLAENLTNLESTRDLSAPVQIVADSINEVSKGLCIHGEEELQLLPTEKRALHCKLHYWFYQTWCQNYDRDIDSHDHLDGFPSLPTFGTRMYISIVQEIQWEHLLIECLLFSSLTTLPMKLQDIITAISDQPDSKDLVLFTLLFDNLLDFEPPSNILSDPSSSDILINALASLSESIIDDHTQVVLIKALIEYEFQMCFGVKLISEQTSLEQCLQEYNKQPLQMDFSFMLSSQNAKDIPITASKIEKLTSLELQKFQDSLESRFCSRSERGSHTSFESGKNDGDTTNPIVDISKIFSSLELLMKLFTEQWIGVCHWTEARGGEFGQINLSTWHPLHRWVLALYANLSYITKDNSHDKLQWFCSELAKYVEVFASKSEREWVSEFLQGVIPDWSIWSEQVEESFDVTGSQQTFMFTSDSLEESLKTAVWRINQNLAGSADCFNWLLTTEELFDDPTWLECIRENATNFAGKDQLVMFVEILCMQRQMLELEPESSDIVFIGIKEVVLDVFKELPSLDQEEVLKYTFSMSVLSGLDVKQDSVLFHPSHAEDNKRTLLEELQVVFNKIVDSSVAAVFTTALNDIKHMALVCPYLVLSKALHEAVKFGHSNTVIYKILQEVPILCTLTTSESSPTLLCQILSSMPASLNTKQEEKNFIKLVQLLLQPYKQENLPGSSPPLLNRTELVQTCIIPTMKLGIRENTASLKLTLKLLKASLSVLDIKTQTSKTFILKYLIPITLTLLKQLNACKVSWEGMHPQIFLPLSLAEAAAIRSAILDLLKVSVNSILSCIWGHVAEVTSPVAWLSQKVKELDWTTGLHIKPLKDLLPSQHYNIIPTCVMEVCELPQDKWKPCEIPNCDVVHCLFHCCAVSDAVLSEVVDNLKKHAFHGMADSLNDQVVKSLCQVMTYLTTAEMARVMLLCKELITLGALDSKEVAGNPISLKPSTRDIPNLNSAYIVSTLLYQVFQRVSQSCFPPWDSQVIVLIMVKHYVTTIKSVCQELVADSTSDKSLVDDVIAHVFTIVCHVISLVPVDVTDPLFILALDVASSVDKRHAIVLRDCVAMVPTSVYTESLLQKLGT